MGVHTYVPSDSVGGLVMTGTFPNNVMHVYMYVSAVILHIVAHSCVLLYCYFIMFARFVRSIVSVKLLRKTCHVHLTSAVYTTYRPSEYDLH